MLCCFFSQHIDNLYFCDFNLYLDCIKIYLDFNYNYNLVLIEKNKKKIIYFLIKLARESTRLTHQHGVGRTGFKFF